MATDDTPRRPLVSGPKPRPSFLDAVNAGFEAIKADMVRALNEPLWLTAGLPELTDAERAELDARRAAAEKEHRDRLERTIALTLLGRSIHTPLDARFAIRHEDAALELARHLLDGPLADRAFLRDLPAVNDLLADAAMED